MDTEFRVQDKKRDHLRALILNNDVDAFILFLLSLHVNIDLFLYTLYIHIYMTFAQLVQALRYKPEGRWFDSRWGYWKFY